MLIVDTFNVLHVTGVLPPALAGLDVHELAQLVRSSRFARQRVLLVCDGAAPRRSGGGGIVTAAGSGPGHLPAGAGVHIVFAGGGVEADTAIEAMLGREHFRGGTVVSNDRRVQAAARRARMGVLPAERFLRTLSGDHAAAETRERRAAPRPAFATDLPLDRHSVGRWLAAMGVDAGLAREITDAAKHLPPEPATAPPVPTVAASRAAPLARGGKTTPAERPGAASAKMPDPALLRLLREYGLDEHLASLEMDRWLDTAPPRPHGPSARGRSRGR